MSYKRTEKGEEFNWAINKEYTLFWKQYKFMVANYYSYYCRLLDKYGLESEFAGFDDFYCSSWLIIKKAIDAVKPENIPDQNKWFAYMQIGFYLRNWVNRQLIIKRIKERAEVNVLKRNIYEIVKTSFTEQ